MVACKDCGGTGVIRTGDVEILCRCGAAPTPNALSTVHAPPERDFIDRAFDKADSALSWLEKFGEDPEEEEYEEEEYEEDDDE